MTDPETIALRVTVISGKRWPDDFTVIWRDLPIGLGDRRGVRTKHHLHRLEYGTKEHERYWTVSYMARLVCVGGDGACVHRDLFYHPIFDGGVKTRRDYTSKKPPPDLTTVTAFYANRQIRAHFSWCFCPGPNRQLSVNCHNPEIMGQAERPP